MQRNFLRGNQRCGYYNAELEHGGPEGVGRKRRSNDDFDVDRYDRENPANGIRQITTGYRKWAERYISQCGGQRNHQHQINRMNLWNANLQAHLANQL